MHDCKVAPLTSQTLTCAIFLYLFDHFPVRISNFDLCLPVQAPCHCMCCSVISNFDLCLPVQAPCHSMCCSVSKTPGHSRYQLTCKGQRRWLLSTGSGMACMFTIANFQGVLVDSHQLGDICLQLKLKSHRWRHHHSSGGPRPIGSRLCLWGCTAFWPRWRNMLYATASQNR